MVMRRSGLVGMLLSASLLASCVTNSASIFISGAVLVDTGGCVLDANGDRAVSTTIDGSVALTGSSVNVAFVVENLIRQRSFNIATDTSTVLVNQAEISINDAAGSEVVGGFIVDLASGVIPGSADGITPGRGLVVVPVMPPAVLQAIGASGVTSPTTFFAEITLRGETIGHLEVEGGPFQWSITVLPSGAYGGDCAATGGVACCNPGQNAEIYCTDAANAGLCRPGQ